MDRNETTESPARHDLPGGQVHAYRRDAGGWNVFGASPYGIALSDEAVRELHRLTEMYNETPEQVAEAERVALALLCPLCGGAHDPAGCPDSGWDDDDYDPRG